MIKIVNHTVPEALHRLGYTEAECRGILDYIDANDMIEGAPHLKTEHLEVFDCAFKPAKGTRSIHYKGHIKMMSAVQPFLSGAISKTVNMPSDATVEEVMDVYMEGWRLGLKAVAIYRDGCKRSQPLTLTKQAVADKKEEKIKEIIPTATVETYAPRRRRLPDERKALTHKFQIGSHEGYITVGQYDDGTPGEVFITMNKEGSTLSGLMDAFSTSVSVGLQYGVPLKILVNKFSHVRFEPSGFTANPNIRVAKSIIDYIFRWLGMKFLSPEERKALGLNVIEGGAVSSIDTDLESFTADAPKQATLLERGPQAATSVDMLQATFSNQSDAPPCDTCGTMMVRNGACYKCLNCGSVAGCS
jgi:ribonucleoside-diphosphate reductase alpha chain